MCIRQVQIRSRIWCRLDSICSGKEYYWYSCYNSQQNQTLYPLQKQNLIPPSNCLEVSHFKLGLPLTVWLIVLKDPRLNCSLEAPSMEIPGYL